MDAITIKVCVSIKQCKDANFISRFWFLSQSLILRQKYILTDVVISIITLCGELFKTKPFK